jgi:hypothetical protein
MKNVMETINSLQAILTEHPTNFVQLGAEVVIELGGEPEEGYGAYSEGDLMKIGSIRYDPYTGKIHIVVEPFED